MNQIAIFIVTTLSALAALGRVDGQSSNVDNSVDSTSYIITTADYSTMKSTAAPPDEKDKWLIYVSAGPTVFIFLICVIAISVKNCSGSEKEEPPRDENCVLSPTTTTVPTSPMSLLKPKPKIINEVYDKMLEQFKDDKNKNKTFVGRKCSQIHIQGVESGSPKSLARKHIIIGKLSGKKEEDIGEVDEDPIKSLVRESTTTFIGGPLIKGMRTNESITSDDTLEIKDTVRGILKTSIDDLTEADRRTYCDEINEVLLPEDLEEAFKNFEFWAESYA